MAVKKEVKEVVVAVKKEVKEVVVAEKKPVTKEPVAPVTVDQIKIGSVKLRPPKRRGEPKE